MLRVMFVCFVLGVINLSSVSSLLLDNVDGPAGDDVPPLAEPPLKIASFNIQVFGLTKFGHKDVVEILVKILSRYDIIQVLEIRDSSETVFTGLKDELNRYVQNQTNTNDTYEAAVSERLGRSSSKEQYGFLYRRSMVQLTDTFQYQDTNDVFEREPFAVRFYSPSTVVSDFALVASHIKPDDAAEEMDNLTDVFETVKKHWNLEDIILAGDFNSDCNYLKLGDWSKISIRTDTQFTWLVEDGLDTTVNDRFCCYDRFVAAGSRLEDAVVPGSVKAFRFDEEMGLNQSTGLRVSDHYPIEMELKGKPHMPTQQNIQTSISFTVRDVQPVIDINDIRNIYRDPSCAGANFKVNLEMEQTHMEYVSARVITQTADQVKDVLNNLRLSCPGTLSRQILSVIDGYIASGFLSTSLPNVYGLVFSQDRTVFDTVVKCHLQVPYICEVSVTKQLSGF